jgi:hypothetical protein
MDRPVTTRTLGAGKTMVLVTYGNYKSGVWINGHYCEGGQPDVGVGVEQSLGSTLKASGPMDGEASASSAEAALNLLNKTAITALAGRSQAVLVTRDLLFYSCLLSANNIPGTDPAWARLDSTIALVRDIAAAEQTQAKANVTNAETAKAAVGIAESEVKKVSPDPKSPPKQ